MGPVGLVGGIPLPSANKETTGLEGLVVVGPVGLVGGIPLPSANKETIGLVVVPVGGMPLPSAKASEVKDTSNNEIPKIFFMVILLIGGGYPDNSLVGGATNRTFRSEMVGNTNGEL